ATRIRQIFVTQLTQSAESPTVAGRTCPLEVVMTHAMMLTRIALGAAFGAAIGYERDRHRRTVGLRTHCLVGLASATFMVVSAQFAFAQGYGADWHVEVDASRIA